MNDQRLTQLSNWLHKTLPAEHWQLQPLAGDASFRRYFRVNLNDRTLIVMDAPPDKENCRPFVAIAKAFAQLGIDVPNIIASDFEQGFLLLSDLGDELYLKVLNAHNADLLYEQALMALQRIQKCRTVLDWELPHFDEKLLLRELELFPEWFLKRHLSLTIDTKLQQQLNKLFTLLIQTATKQPQVCVHRDYHSRNLLWREGHEVGVLDFQDAVWGPVTYDTVSLLRDCYIAWPQAQIAKWGIKFYDSMRDEKILTNQSSETFWHWLDWLGLQRHLKVLGVFTRLHHRDGKSTYLGDIPRILDYMTQVCEQYTELKEFSAFLQLVAKPKFMEQQLV